MAFEQQLRIPGPAPLPDRVVRAQSRPMIDHRGPEGAELIADLVSDLRWALETNNDVLLFPGSGTGGLEAAMVNLVSPGERILVCSVGNFGDRWADLGQAFGADVVRLEATWGEPNDPEDIERVLAQEPDIRTVFVTHNETSTGVANDMQSIAAVVKGRGRLLAVDSVSGAGSMPLPVDKLGLDVVVAGSQKGWMAAPGLTMISVGADAWEATRRSTMPRWYWDFQRQKGFIDQGSTYTTPPLSVMFGLREGLAMMREEGLAGVFSRHQRVADMIRAGLEAMGLRLFAAEGYRSNTVTTVHSPFPTPDAMRAFVRDLRVEHGLVIAGGQARLAGTTFRIGHLGFIGERDAYGMLAAIELALAQHGLLSRTGLAVPAAQSVVRGAAKVAIAAGASS